MESCFVDKYHEKRIQVLNELETVLKALDVDALEKMVDDICEAEHVFLIGVGRVLLSCQAFAKRLCHVGISACCVGDITEPALTEKDIVIVASGSGESIIPVAIAKKARELNAKKIIHIGSNPESSLKAYVDYMVRIPTRTKLNLSDEIPSEQIMTSLFEQSLLILGDIISQMIVDEKQIEMELLWKYHANLE